MIWNTTQLSSVFKSYYKTLKDYIAKYKQQNTSPVANSLNQVNSPLLANND
jgi:hypothetical protein